MANIAAKGSVTVGRSAQEVWEFISDPEKLHLWVDDINSPGSWLDGGSSNVVGSNYRIDYSYGRKVNEIIFEVTHSIPGQSYGINTVKGPYPITSRYLLSPSTDGNSTELVHSMIARSESKFTTIVFILTRWIAKPFMRKKLNKELKKMRDAIASS